MSQIFHRSANTIARVSIFGAVFFVAGSLYLFDQVNRSSWMTEAHVAREQPVPRAGARKPPHRQVARVDPRARPARLRALQSQHSRREGCRLHDLPRPGRPHAPDVAGEVAPDGMVPRLPSAAGKIRPAASRGVQRRLRGAAGSDGSRKEAGRGIPDTEADELLD